jgi:outer membrane receptor protein involved in Fe transport
VDVDGAPVAEALRQVLRDVPVELWVSTTGKMALVPIRADDPGPGSIVGHVTDARTGQGVVGARVSVVARRFSTVTNDSGGFRITDVPPGSYTLTVRRIGYVQANRAIVVTADRESVADVRLDPSVTPLNAVVVTGTVTEARQKELPNPITVVTGDQLLQRGASKINDLFRGDIPGLFAADYGAANQSYGAPVYVRGTTELLGVPTLKTYIDGVEIANSEYLNEIDPAMIDHVEIVRGPQASTLYGAQAMNGVMQVFTKKGRLATPPRLTISTGVGALEGSYNTGMQQEDNAALAGGTTDLSYNLGVTYRHEGAWTPGHYTDTYSSYGTLSLQPAGSPVQVDLNARIGHVSSRANGGEATARAVMDGTLQLQPGLGEPIHNVFNLPQQTLGMTVRYTPRPNWHHSLTVGLDRGANGNDAVVSPRFTEPSDSFTDVFSTQTARTTAAYNSSFDLNLAERLTANLVVGGDYWNYREDDYTDYQTTTAVGELGIGGPNSIFVGRERDHSTGVFTQARLGFADALFLTAGVRVDFGPDLPADRHHRYAAPRIGLSYVVDAGPVRAKLRGGFGSALKPPKPTDKAFIQFSPTYIQFASPNLLPERQTGWDAGIDLYSGDRTSLSVTRYRQLAHDLFYAVYGQQGAVFTQQIQNVALVRNSGWELEGTLQLFQGLSVRGTYSYVESVVDSLGPNDQTGFHPGDALPGVPHHTGALTLTETTSRYSAEASVSYVGTSVNYDQGRLYQTAYPRLGTPDFGSAYAWRTLPSAYRLGVRLSYDLSSRVTLYAHGENLTNRIVYDQGFIPIDQLGRTTMVGLRLR